MLIFLAASSAMFGLIYYWALSPTFSLIEVLGPIGESQTDFIRRVRRIRIVQPEWLTAEPNHVDPWFLLETVSRLINLLLLLWGVIWTSVFRRHFKQEKTARTRSDQ